MRLPRLAGMTNAEVKLVFLDSATGVRETGVNASTPGLSIWYRREAEAVVTLASVNNLSALTDAHNDEGILHVSSGEYRLDLPDAAVAAGAKFVDWGASATGMIAIGGRIDLLAYDPLTVDLAAMLEPFAESYHIKGDPATLAQLNWAVYSLLTSALKSGALMTVRKQDGTTAYTLALNDATNPTDVVRST